MRDCDSGKWKNRVCAFRDTWRYSQSRPLGCMNQNLPSFPDMQKAEDTKIFNEMVRDRKNDKPGLSAGYRYRDYLRQMTWEI